MKPTKKLLKQRNSLGGYKPDPEDLAPPLRGLTSSFSYWEMSERDILEEEIEQLEFEEYQIKRWRFIETQCLNNRLPSLNKFKDRIYV